MSVRPPRRATGHEQQGARPAVVVQSDHARWLGTIIVAPTSSSAPAAEWRPEITVRGRRTRVLLDQLKSIDASRLGRSSGNLSAADLDQVDEALKLILGLL